MAAQSVLSLCRGSEVGIKALTDLEDGRLLFATDSKKIYLDCDFTTGEGTKVQKRIAFGGSTAVLYGAKSFTDAEIEQEDFTFGVDDIENIEELPEVDSLILNTLDGSFYRVTDIDVENGVAVSERLSVSGSGGTGGGGGAGYIVAKIVNGATRYYTMREEQIPIEFSCMSSIEGAVMSAKIYINNIEVANIEGISQSMTATNIIDLKPYIDNIGSSFLVNESNNVSVVLTDDYGATKTLKYYITIFNLYVSPSVQSIPVQTGSFLYQCRPYGGVGLQNRQLIFELRNVGEENVIWNYTMSLANQQDGSAVNLTIPFQTHGTYNLSVYITGIIPQTGAELTSEPLVQQVMFYESGQSAPLISVSALDSYRYQQYDFITMQYMIAYDATTHSTVNLIVDIETDEGRKRYGSTVVYIENNKLQDWDMTFSLPGYYYLTIQIDGTEYSQTAPVITVTEFADDVPDIDEDNSALELYLSAAGHSNTEAARDRWVYKNSRDGSEISCRFENFNWQSNGWKTDDEGLTSLHLDNGAKLVIPFSPFPSNGNVTSYGKTIELDFKISNVRSSGEELITCISTNRDGVDSSQAVVGFVITESQSALNSGSLKTIGETASTAAQSEKGLIATFKEDERIHITYAINSLTDDPARMVYTYINGTISGLVRYASSDTFADATGRPSEFVFVSDNADIDIYNIRVYAQALDGRSVLYNYIADQGDPEEMVAAWEDNDVLDANTAKVSLVKIAQRMNIPYMVFEDGRKSDKNGVITSGATVGALPTGKKDYRYCNVYYVDPAHANKNFPTEEEKKNDTNPITTVPMVVYGQGTSSMSYPVKNLRIKFLPVERTAADGSKETYKRKYALRNGDNGDITPVNLFCLKADYMESSSAHNTGTGNTLSELYNSIKLYTPAQYVYGKQEYLTAIVGHPIICFFKPYGSSNYEYIGRYNFNLDKATPEPFGFFEESYDHYGVRLESYPEWNDNYKSEALKKATKGGFDHTLDSEPDASKTYYTAPNLDSAWSGTKEQFKNYITKVGCLYEYSEDAARSIQCWEFLDNGQALCGMRIPWDEATDAVTYDKKDQPYPTWRSSFECRYPEPEDQVCADKRAMGRVINWLVSTNQNLATNEELPEDEWLYVEDNGATVVYNVDNKAYRLLKFKQQFYDYFRMDYTAFYYVLTEVLCMMDSRAKNMMFCTFDADPDAGTGHWFPIFYDMDTMLGVNNSGVLEFDYNVEDNTVGRQVYNGSSSYSHDTYSVLWCNFREAFFSEIRNMYNNLRYAGKLTYNHLMELYNKTQANKWNETYINEDAHYKYIRPLVEEWWDDNEGKYVGGANGGIDYLYIGQGTRSEHRAYWLYNRLNYLDTKYEYVRSTGAQPDVDFRTNTPSGKVEYDDQGNVTVDSEMALKYQKSLAAVPSDLSFDLTSLVDQFAMMKFSQTETAPVKVLAGQTVKIDPPANLSANDTETFIQAAVNYTDYGDLASKYVSKFIFNKAVKIRKLKLGDESPDYYNPKLSSLGTGFATVVPFLEELDIQHCHALSGTLDLSACSYLQTVKAKGTSYTNITFPVGGNLKYISLPSTVNTLKIHNHLYYDTRPKVDEETGETTVNLEFDSYENLSSLWIQECPLVDTKAIITNAPYLRNVRLMDMNWTLSLDECTIENGLIVGAPILDKLIYSKAILAEGEEYDVNNIIHGLDANGQQVERTDVGNQYLAGTITIDNGTTGVSDMAFYNKYNKFFPNIKFVYADNSNNVKAYTINICDAQKQTQYRYLHKLSATATDVATFDANLEDWFEDPDSTPVLIKTQSVKYKYQFLGWNTTEPRDYEEDKVSEADKILVMKIDVAEDGTRTATRMNNFKLTEDKFSNMEFSFYPTYAAIIQEYTVNFYRDEEHTDLLKSEKVKYGGDATPPPDPLKLELPPSLNPDGSPDNNVTMCYSYPFQKYSIGYTNVVGNVNTHAVYGNKVELKTIPADASYFKGTTDASGYVIELQPGFIEEAITIPATYNNYTVTKVTMIKDNAPNLRRIYFQGGNHIEIIDFDFSNSTTLEYVDFPALNNGVFAEVRKSKAFSETNIYMNDILPDTIEYMDTYIFAKCPYVNITKLPASLSQIGSSCFRDTPISSINLSTMTPTALSELPTSLFEGCTNLSLVGNNITGDSLHTIGERTFYGCTNMELDFNGGASSIKHILTRAFAGDGNVKLASLPAGLESVENAAFTAAGFTAIEVGFSSIPSTMTKIGNNAFNSRKIAADLNGIRKLYMPCAQLSDVHDNAFAAFTIDQIVIPDSIDKTAAPWNKAPWGATKSNGDATDVVKESELV